MRYEPGAEPEHMRCDIPPVTTQLTLLPTPPPVPPPPVPPPVPPPPPPPVPPAPPVFMGHMSLRVQGPQPLGVGGGHIVVMVPGAQLLLVVGFTVQAESGGGAGGIPTH